MKCMLAFWAQQIFMCPCFCKIWEGSLWCNVNRLVTSMDVKLWKEIMENIEFGTTEHTIWTLCLFAHALLHHAGLLFRWYGAWWLCGQCISLASGRSAVGIPAISILLFELPFDAEKKIDKGEFEMFVQKLTLRMHMRLQGMICSKKPLFADI